MIIIEFIFLSICINTIGAGWDFLNAKIKEAQTDEINGNARQTMNFSRCDQRGVNVSVVKMDGKNNAQTVCVNGHTIGGGKTGHDAKRRMLFPICGENECQCRHAKCGDHKIDAGTAGNNRDTLMDAHVSNVLFLDEWFAGQEFNKGCSRAENPSEVFACGLTVFVFQPCCNK